MLSPIHPRRAIVVCHDAASVQIGQAISGVASPPLASSFLRRRLYEIVDRCVTEAVIPELAFVSASNMLKTWHTVDLVWNRTNRCTWPDIDCGEVNFTLGLGKNQ